MIRQLRHWYRGIVGLDVAHEHYTVARWRAALLRVGGSIHYDDPIAYLAQRDTAMKSYYIKI